MEPIDVPLSQRLRNGQEFHGLNTSNPPCPPPDRALPLIPQIDEPIQGYQLPANDSNIQDWAENDSSALDELSAFHFKLPWCGGSEYQALSILLNNSGRLPQTNFSYPTPSLSPPEATGVKRTVPGDGEDEQSQRPLKSARVAPADDPELANLASDEYYDSLVVAPAHLDNGLIDGRYHCSCGKSYTRRFRLNDHLDLSNGAAKIVCSLCPATFKRDDTRLRHERTAHLGEKWPCPICFRTFRADYIHQHLRSKGNGCREALSAALRVQGTQESKPLSGPVYFQYWAARPSEDLPVAETQPHVQSSEHVVHSIDLDTLAEKFLRDHPPKVPPASVYRRSREPCNICGEEFGPDEDDLIKHIERHSTELATRPFRCEDCHIDFAFARDLERHRNLAELGHCGFNFCHDKKCWGHHPGDIWDMPRRLEAWETCQIRAHRLAILQLLLERLEYRRAARFSLNDCFSELSCLKTMDRFSKISVDSFSSVPAWLKMDGDGEVEELARRLGLLHITGTKRFSMVAPSRPRPESMVLDIASDGGPGIQQQRPSLKIHNAQADINLPGRFTYSQMVGKLRKPSESPGPSQNRFRQAANNAAKFLKASNSHGREIRHLGSTTR
ncbi:hypothetical protein PRZ48_005728 [Zasmidium cellare]|uniref:C2H2-type domain-containing protein n=1 Tax=Zasmidium cellare TaxID=395010 RepID=A0ABR0EMF0_ZASCE|nr:hypothetical protein PRZ48_005728 [Zasmidium cellare]